MKYYITVDNIIIYLLYLHKQTNNKRFYLSLNTNLIFAITLTTNI